MAAKGNSDFELTGLFTAFDQLEDPGSSINRLHPLSSVLSIAVLAVLCGADGPTDAKSNEITAIPQVLQLVDVCGAIITIDAMGAQTAIVKEIVDRKGDVIICLKGNQGNLYNAVSDFVDDQIESGFSEVHHEELHEPAKWSEAFTCRVCL